MSKLMKIGIPVLMLMSASALSETGEGYSQDSLEPCMNGEVSASGAFRSDAAERQFLLTEEVGAEEPCISGDVPPDGVRIENRFDGTMEQVLTAGKP